MKNVLFLFLLFSSSFVFAEDKVTLKSGYVIKGTVIAFENGILRIRLSNGTEKKGKISAVKRIDRF